MRCKWISHGYCSSLSSALPRHGSVRCGFVPRGGFLFANILFAAMYRRYSGAHGALSHFLDSLVHLCRSCSIQAVPDSAPHHATVSSAPTGSPDLPLAAASAHMNVRKGPADDLMTRVDALSTSSMVVGLVFVQALTLVGSLVGGHLARKRRKEVETVNQKLRTVRSLEIQLHIGVFRTLCCLVMDAPGCAGMDGYHIEIA